MVRTHSQTFLFVNLLNSVFVHTELQEFHGLTLRTVFGSAYHKHALPFCRSHRKSVVYMVPQLRHLSYCSPQCLDEEFLPEYNKKLERVRQKVHMQSRALHHRQLQPMQQDRRKIELEKKPKEGFGVTLSTSENAVAQVCMCVCV